MSWKAEGYDAWGGSVGGDTGGGTNNDGWGGGADADGSEDTGGAGGNSEVCRVCKQEGHFARECPDKPAGGGLTGECFNCGEVGHNKADCTNPKVERPFTGTCNLCSEEGHPARNCPKMTCRLCREAGHRAADCTNRRAPNWIGIPELSVENAWTAVAESAKVGDLDTFRFALKAYARAVDEDFKLPEVEAALRQDNTPVYLIAKKQDVADHNTIVDMIGNPGREYVLTFHLSDKPRRKKMAVGWPESKEEDMTRLASCGFIEDGGVPRCSNCGVIGHVRKHCKESVEIYDKPKISCIYCKEEGHRARDCPQERPNFFACKNCKQEGHDSKDCPEPRSAADVECRKCSQMGHFSKDCPNGEARNCHNCGSANHLSKECDQPRNPDTVACRNCDKLGHFARDCPEPRDWSRVKCGNCGEMGHTIKRCKQPPAENDGDAQASGDWDTGNDAQISGDWNTGDGAAAASGGGW